MKALACISIFLLLLFAYPLFFENGFSGAGRNCEAASDVKTVKTGSNLRPASAAPGESYGSREMIEKEEALNLKEQELKKMSSKLDDRMKELEDKRKSLESSIAADNKVNDEKYKKMIKLYKSLRPEEAAGLIGKLDEDTAFEMLNRMDTKTTAKLVPYLDQKMVLKWTRLTLTGK